MKHITVFYKEDSDSTDIRAEVVVDSSGKYGIEFYTGSGNNPKTEWYEKTLNEVKDIAEDWACNVKLLHG